MRKSPLALFVAVPLLVATFAVHAQERPPKLEDVPAPPPLPSGISEEDFEPEVTIIKRGEDTVEEFRINGQLYKIKVTPPHGKPYFLIDRKGDGVFERETGDHQLSVPMWVIKTW